jgi:serine/threonine protein kinase
MKQPLPNKCLSIFCSDTSSVEDFNIVGTELAITARLSNLARRGICPNFVKMRAVFTCAHEPPESVWGSSERQAPRGPTFVPGRSYRKPKEPESSEPSRFQYIRMELCSEGDAEELLKNQPNKTIAPALAQSLVFQAAFALHAAADRCSLKHYDVKLLNLFVNMISTQKENVVLRYGLGSHVFAIKMPSTMALVAKLADFGMSNVKPETNGQPVTIAQFTTLENTPADFLILGDRATQGHGHDCFGLGLCMLHLFTGHAPYEELMKDVFCPPHLKKSLRNIWENDNIEGFEVIRSVILCDVFKDETGNIIDGDPDETLYDTLYRLVVLFGIPSEKDQFQKKDCPRVWKALSDNLEESECKSRRDRIATKKTGPDAAKFQRDQRMFSLQWGDNHCIRTARQNLEAIDGGMELLLHLCSFNPATRASAMDVLNSKFMENLRERPGDETSLADEVYSYTAFSTHY